MKNLEKVLEVLANGVNGVDNIVNHYDIEGWLHVVVLELTWNMLNTLKDNILRMEHDADGIEVVFTFR